MMLKSHRIALLALPIVIAAIAAPGVSAGAPQFPSARQVAMHEDAPNAAAIHPTPQLPTAREIAMHEGRLTTPSVSSNEARAAADAGFQWGNAGIGAGAMLLLITTILVGAFLVHERRQRSVRRTSGTQRHRATDLPGAAS